LAWCDKYNGDIEDALPLALAIECIHTSSLIQDDLPCMDNSVERRGLPSMHIHFNESTAILTSDILINAAYYYII
jgi:geranylgeranyl pyrophosphate synthase